MLTFISTWRRQDDYNDVKEDMQEGCGAHGKLVMEALLKLLHCMICMLDLEEVINYLITSN